MEKNIKTIGVLGTGVIGASWAALFLARGLKVILNDPAPGSEERFKQYLDKAWITLEKVGLSEGACKTNYQFVDSLVSRIDEIDFVQENGPERQDLRSKIVAELDAKARSEVVIASSSSGMPASKFISMCENAPERVVVAHPFNPPHLMPLVEVVPHPKTNKHAVNTAMAFYRSLGKRPILINHEIPGFVANRLQAAVNNEAYSLISRGIVSAQDLDVAMTNGPGLRWALNGPVIINTMGGGGGKGGFQQRLDRLGPEVRSWEEDILLHRFKWTENEQSSLKDKVRKYLDGVNLTEISNWRDLALLEVLQVQGTTGDHV